MSKTNNRSTNINKIRGVCGICSSKNSPDPDSNSNDIPIHCQTCKKWYHKFCTGLNNTKFEDAKAQKYYYCLNCLQNSNFTIEFARLSQSINQTLPGQTADEESIDGATDFNSLDVDSLEAMCKDHMKRIWPFLKDQVQDIININMAPICTSNDNLLKRVEQLERHIDEIHRKQRHKNVIIRGVPEDIPIVGNSLAFKLGSSINFELQDRDVTSVQRLRNKKHNQQTNHQNNSVPNKNPPLILISFTNPSIKMNFMKQYFNAMKKGIFIQRNILFNNSSRSISGNPPSKLGTSRIFIGEHLDRSTLSIILRLRRLKHNKLITNFNTKLGKAYVKVEENDQFKIMDSMDAVTKLEEKILLLSKIGPSMPSSTARD